MSLTRAFPRSRAVPVLAFALALAAHPAAAQPGQPAQPASPAQPGQPAQPASQPAQPAQQRPPALQQVRGLGLDSLAGPLPVHYSAGFAARAGEVQSILRDGARFFADSLGLQTTVQVALLGQADWQRISQVPYGVPYVQGGVVFIPAAGDGAIVEDFLRLEPNASPAAREKVAETGVSFAENARRMTDLIGYHELGHGYTDAYGIRAHTRWLNEFLATYMAYAYLYRAQPRLARGWEAMLQAKLDGPVPAHTSLATFDSLYIRVGPENYNWYQAAFALQAAEVFQAEGLGFLARLRDAFPASETGPRLDGEAVLARLEQVRPGFRAWAEGLAGRPGARP